MSTIHWQCYVCGKQKEYQSQPALDGCKCEEKRHDWRDMGKAINDNDFWRCVYCGRSASNMNHNAGYPVEKECLARKKSLHIWKRFTNSSSDCKKWKCQKCSRQPHQTDKLLQSKGIPSPNGGISPICSDNKMNGVSHFHLWEYVSNK